MPAANATVERPPRTAATEPVSAPADRRLPAPIEAVTAGFFGALSRLRGARIFHPRGIGYEATVVVDRGVAGYPDVPLLERPAAHPAIVRFSRAAGLPEPLPDVLGLTLRLIDLHGPGRHQDFLLVTSLEAPVLQHLLLPAPGGFLSQPYSSLLAYRMGGNVRLVGARPATDPAAHSDRGTLGELAATAATGDLRFRLTLGELRGRWSSVGTLEVGDRLDDRAVEELAFNPWFTGGGIRPVGPLMGLRRAAYAGSQRGRGLDPAQIP